MFLGTSSLLLSLLPLAPSCCLCPGTVGSCQPWSLATVTEGAELTVLGQVVLVLCADKDPLLIFRYQLEGVK